MFDVRSRRPVVSLATTVPHAWPPAWSTCTSAARAGAHHQVRTPTVVIHCDRDQAVPAEAGRLLAATIPNARYVSLPSANHLMVEEEPAWSLFLEEVGLFLDW